MSKILEGDILGPEPDPEKIRADERKVRAEFWNTLRKAAGRIPFAEDLVASYYCALDPATPNRTRAILLGALAYFVLPLDWVPDFILGLGFTDDVAVLLAAINAVRANLADVHYIAARRMLAGSGASSGGQDDRETDGRRAA